MAESPDENNKQPVAISRGLALVVAAGLGILLGALIWTFMAPDPGDRQPQPIQYGLADIGGSFSLIDHNGNPVTNKDFEGGYTLIYFGYTFCPDVCPLGLLFMQDVLKDLGKAGEAITPLFITIDPDRDTPAIMKDYVGAFHPRLVGLTGTPEAIAEVAEAYKVYYRKAAPLDPEEDPEEDPNNYGMDHMNIFFLMGPDGGYRAHFLSPTSPADTAEEIRSHLPS